MKYEKPIVIANKELAEGVYAASGSVNGDTCYTATAYIHQSPEEGRGDYRIQVNGVHSADHTNNEQLLYISFNNPVTYKSSNGVLVSGNGTNMLVIKYSYWQNPNDNIGLGDLVVESDAGLSVTSVKITD